MRRPHRGAPSRAALSILTALGLAAAVASAVSAPADAGSPARRYLDLADGTVRDTRSGLVWLADAGCLGAMSRDRAQAAVADLEDGRCGLTDGSKPGDWRLPTADEWEAMVDCSCGEIALGDDRGTGCYSSGGSSFRGVETSDYWSSTVSRRGGTVRVMSLVSGLVGGSDSGASLPAWPVRD